MAIQHKNLFLYYSIETANNNDSSPILIAYALINKMVRLFCTLDLMLFYDILLHQICANFPNHMHENYNHRNKQSMYPYERFLILIDHFKYFESMSKGYYKVILL